MFTFKSLALAAIALGTIAIATPAEAHDRGYRHKHINGRIVSYDSPSHHREYRSHRHHRYYRSYSHDTRPRVTIAFGGTKHKKHHHYHRR